jgi:hypothetical protein
MFQSTQVFSGHCDPSQFRAGECVFPVSIHAGPLSNTATCHCPDPARSCEIRFNPRRSPRTLRPIGVAVVVPDHGVSIHTGPSGHCDGSGALPSSPQSNGFTPRRSSRSAATTCGQSLSPTSKVTFQSTQSLSAIATGVSAIGRIVHLTVSVHAGPSGHCDARNRGIEQTLFNVSIHAGPSGHCNPRA